MRALWIGAAVAATALITFACGDGKDSGGDEETVTTSSFAQPQTLAITGGDVVLPAGAFPEGTTVEVKKASEPSEFGGAGTAASASVGIAAKDASGGAVVESAKPFTIGLEISDASLTEGSLETLCLFGLLTKGATKAYWPYAMLGVDAATKKVAAALQLLGVFQLRHCGGKAEGFVAGTKGQDGTLTAAATASGTTGGGGPTGLHGSCTIASAGLCYGLNGKLYAEAQIVGTYKEACEKSQGTYATSGCTTENAVGTCAYFHGTTTEQAYTYYSNGAQPHTAENAQKSCELIAPQVGSKWFATGTYAPTAPESQTTYQAPAQNPAGPAPGPAPAPSPATGGDAGIGTACGQPTRSGCMKEGTTSCEAFQGATYTSVTIAQTCGSNRPVSATGCPTANVVGCCKLANLPQGLEKTLVFYAPVDFEDVQAACGTGQVFQP